MGWMETEVKRGGNKSNMILEVIRYGEHVLRPEEKGTPSFELGGKGERNGEKIAQINCFEGDKR